MDLKLYLTRNRVILPLISQIIKFEKATPDNNLEELSRQINPELESGLNFSHSFLST